MMKLSSTCDSDLWGVNRLIVYFLFFFLIYVVTYLALFPRTGPHWDEVLDWNGGATDTYLVAGRWGTYLYRLVMGKGAMPWCGGLVAGIYISVALVLQTKLLKLSSPVLSVIYAGIYMACNQWSSQLVYSFLCDSVGLGVLFSTLSVYMLILKNSNFWSAVLLSLSLSSYQTNGVYWFVLLAAVVISQNYLNKKAFLRFGCTAVLALLVYFTMQKIFMALIDIPSETISYVKGYQKTTSFWGSMSDYPVSIQIMGLAHYFKRSLYQALGMGETFNVAITSAIIPCVLLIVRYVRSKFGKVERMIKIGLVLAIWYAPYVITFLMLGFPGDRVNMAAPVSLAALWVLLFMEYELKPVTNLVVLAGVFTMVIKASYTNGVKSRDEAYAHDIAVRHLHSIYEHGRQLALHSNISNSPILLIFDETSKVKAEDSLFPKYLTDGVLDWYIRHYKLHGMKFAKKTDNAEIQAAICNMPLWPDLNGMKVVNGNIVVRLPALGKN